MEDMMLKFAPEQDCKSLWNEMVKLAIIEKFNSSKTVLDDTISLSNITILPEETTSENLFQNWNNCNDWLNQQGEQECFYFETFTKDDIVEEMNLETDSVLSSSDTLSCYSLGSSCSPRSGSPYMLLIATDSCLDNLETPQGKAQASHPSSNQSPESEHTDYGIADIDVSLSKSNSDGSPSWENFSSCFGNTNLEETIAESPTKDTEIIEIFNKKESEFWYSSDDGESSDDESYAETHVYSPERRKKRKTRRRNNQLANIIETRDNEDDVPNVKISFEAIRKRNSQYRRQLWKNSSMEFKMPHDRWCNKIEKMKLIREREKSKRKLRQMFCKKEAQNADYNQSRSARNRNDLLPDYFY